MYRVSYERCVCFVLLVILAFLSCSGFRIDNLAMTDISRKNSHASRSSSDEFFDGILNASAAPAGVAPGFAHRLRHHRQQQQQQQASRPRDDDDDDDSAVRRAHSGRAPTGRIDAYVLPPPPTDPLDLRDDRDRDRRPRPPPFPTKSLVTRRDTSHKPRQRHGGHQEDRLLSKAYHAKIVLRARAESMSKPRGTNYSVVFRVLEQFKNSSYPVHDQIRLTFSNATARCEGRQRCDHRGLVGADVRTTEEYLLFLDAASAFDYKPMGAPERLPRAKGFDVLKQVCRPDFTPTPTRIVKLQRMQKGQRPLRLRCAARGFPPPRISWRRNGSRLRIDPPRVTVSSLSRRKQTRSTLVVNERAADRDRYECVARGALDDRPARLSWKPPPSTVNSEIYTTSEPRIQCEEEKKAFCMNGGQCFKDRDPEQLYCVCPVGFSGERCTQKKAQFPSMYPHQDDICKLGLSTKYFC